MSNKTVNAIIEQVKDDLELKNSEAYGERSLDPMVSTSYLIQKINDSIEEIQAEVMGQYEDYFLAYNTTALVGDQSEYDLPSNIAINKIRRVYCHNNEDHLDPNTNNDIYKVERFTDIDDIYSVDSGDDYHYMLIDRPATGATAYETKFKTFPKARNSDQYISYWYIRSLSTVSATGDTVSVPFMRFLIEDVKFKTLEKDVGNPMAGFISGNRDKLYALMQKTLANKVPDDRAGYMRPDNSFYESSIL